MHQPRGIAALRHCGRGGVRRTAGGLPRHAGGGKAPKPRRTLGEPRLEALSRVVTHHITLQDQRCGEKGGRSAPPRRLLLLSPDSRKGGRIMEGKG